MRIINSTRAEYVAFRKSPTGYAKTIVHEVAWSLRVARSRGRAKRVLDSFWSKGWEDEEIFVFLIGTSEAVRKAIRGEYLPAPLPPPRN